MNGDEPPQAPRADSERRSAPPPPSRAPTDRNTVRPGWLRQAGDVPAKPDRAIVRPKVRLAATAPRGDAEAATSQAPVTKPSQSADAEAAGQTIDAKVAGQTIDVKTADQTFDAKAADHHDSAAAQQAAESTETGLVVGRQAAEPLASSARTKAEPDGRPRAAAALDAAEPAASGGVEVAFRLTTDGRSGESRWDTTEFMGDCRTADKPIFGRHYLRETATSNANPDRFRALGRLDGKPPEGYHERAHIRVSDPACTVRRRWQSARVRRPRGRDFSGSANRLHR
ncbi:hypothetical protein SAMN05421748_10595 [Paractinoplanes atraurantiacus]|uniref:Uncharacterized protein n=1 Tax=Paractinoplanes atraurantiacus TaxID=1036182 RepID=A0A285HNU5_9ACTN|nr:hypothetical protein SAMN05421748_10595 [Actinoplanes atraurantiacus]